MTNDDDVEQRTHGKGGRSVPSNRKFACVLPSLCLLVWWFSALCRPLSLFSQSQPFLPSFALCHQSLRLRVFVHCGIRSTLATLAAGLVLTLSHRLLAKQSRTGLRCHSLLNCVGVLGHSASGFGLEGLTPMSGSQGLPTEEKLPVLH